MATLITQNSQTVSAVPSAGSLSTGELAVNTADAKLFTKHSDGSVKELGTGFPSGTVMLFVQTSAPTGWTKSTSHNDKALRVVSGTASSGGSVAFSTVMSSTRSVNTSGLSAGATTLSTTQIPSHAHGIAMGDSNTITGSSTRSASFGQNLYTGSTNNAGGGGSHSHSLSGSAVVDLSVQYVDVIIATKD